MCSFQSEKQRFDSGYNIVPLHTPQSAEQQNGCSGKGKKGTDWLKLVRGNCQRSMVNCCVIFNFAERHYGPACSSCTSSQCLVLVYKWKDLRTTEWLQHMQQTQSNAECNFGIDNQLLMASLEVKKVISVSKTDRAEHSALKKQGTGWKGAVFHLFSSSSTSSHYHHQQWSVSS